MQKYDMFVLGTGPAGQRAAVQAAKLGKRVGICERREVVGGVCINTGTIPSKTFREAVLHLTGLQLRGIYGSGYTVKENISMRDLVFRCEAVIKREVQVIRDQMRRNGVTVHSGTGSFVDPHHLVVQGVEGSTEIETEFVVVAVGTVPSPPRGVPIDGRTIVTSDEILSLPELPRSLTVVGAGVIGSEYASMFAALGVEVTLIDGRRRLLEFIDEEIAESLSYQMRNLGCTFRLGEDVESVEVAAPGKAIAVLKSGKKIQSEVLLYSAGRVGATADLNLAAAGIKADERGRITVDAHFQSSAPHIFAAGDVIGFPALASTSMEQGRMASCHAFGVPALFVPELYPYGIYSIPEISMVGKTEEELTREGIPYETGMARYREIARGAILGDDSGLLKILFHRENRRLLGVHIIGTSATELVHIGQAVLAFGGTIDFLVNNVFNYPTFAECYKVAALDGYNKVGPAPLDSPIDWDAFDRERNR
ncbi:MAG: Si-specific NAD(P)(+) transhydrogenase [Candidatus Eisenbacteria bacterium]|nr:Si-specific NAD(P)(+) transhydrogenase [Candidatus Eisenbacteria bacterium]MCC7142970.1 Si-specific NAD(P)(+) transhydrogenase [Candidatus Eisenbacteria bacterium]